MTPDQYCQDKAARSGSSFYYSFLFLSAEKRRAITALYAFCREVDDAVDECTEPSVAAAKLDWWHKEVDALFNRHPTHPVSRALLPHLQAFNIQAARLHTIIEGMQFDLRLTRYETFEELQHYCWHVAGVVGELSAHIFGYTDESTLAYAAKLGLAFQLTNILRDVGDDLRRGRIYLPQVELEKHGVTIADLEARRHTEAFENLMRFQCERARACYREAFSLLPASDRRAQRPGLVMAAIYLTLLNEIERSRYEVLQQRIALPPMRKFWLACKTCLSNGKTALELAASPS